MMPNTVLYRLLFVSTLAVFGASCTTQDSTDEEATSPGDSVIVESPSARDEINSNQSELLSTILGGTDEGIIRGISFGDPASKVKATEPFELFEDSLRHVGYTYETDQLETIDVLYYFTPTGQQVNKITVDVYLNSETATRQLWEAARRRFTEKYGDPQEVQDRSIRWEKSPVRTTITEVSEGKDYGLKFVFEPTGKTSLASR